MSNIFLVADLESQWLQTHDLNSLELNLYSTHFTGWGTFLVLGTVDNLALPLQDLNSGLVGPLIVCRKNTKASIVHRVLHFMIFDENKSWYFEENVNTYSSDPNNIDRNDEEFDLSNQMHGNVH